MLWASSYFESVYHSSKGEAATLGSLFFIGITIGRFISGFVSERLGSIKMIYLGAAIAFIGILFIIIPIKQVAILGFTVLGLGCAPIYPSIIHSTPTSFGKENSASIIGIQMASAYMGSTFIPPIFGIISSVLSLKIMPLYLAFFLILMIIMITKSQKMCKKQ
jgi:fucose permease